MVDSDGDGVWTEEDCKLANGSFDAYTGVLSFDQVRACFFGARFAIIFAGF